MTEPEPDAFEAVVFGDGLEEDGTEEDDLVPRRRAGGPAALFLSVACVATGVVIASGGILAAALAETSTPSAESAEVEAAAPSSFPSDAAEADSRGADQPSNEDAAGVSALADDEWLERLAEHTGIPPRALAAYAGASMQVATEAPGCGLGWNTLAGIGHVESEHGTIHGSRIGDDGMAEPAIIGIPLTGETTLQIRDSDAGVLDGDSVWDRAVGPMQFIPSTWEEWGADGNGDGIRDPQNIDDSALAAARYLCFAGGDLREPDNWIAAVHAYNPTVEYNNRVAEAATHYATLDE